MTTTITRRTALAGLSALAAAPAHVTARAQSGRPITLMHGFTPGANVDITARIDRRRSQQAIGAADRGGDAGGRRRHRLGGGGGARGARRQHARHPAQRPRGVRRDLQAASLQRGRRLRFISMLTENPFILVTYPDHPAKTVADVIKAAQADPAKLTYATAGNGTGMHLASELLVAMAKIKIQHIPYRGSPQAITDLIAKRVDFQVDTPQVLLPFLPTAGCARSPSPRRRGSSPCRTCRRSPKAASPVSRDGMARHRGTCGIAGGVRQQGQRGGPRHPGRARRHREIARARRRPRADHAGRFQGAGRRRRCEMDQSGGGRKHFAGLGTPHMRCHARA